MPNSRTFGMLINNAHVWSCERLSGSVETSRHQPVWYELSQVSFLTEYLQSMPSHDDLTFTFSSLVGLAGFEPAISWVRGPD